MGHSSSTLARTPPLGDPTPHLGKGPEDAGPPRAWDGDRTFKWLTAAFGVGVVLVLLAMVAQMALGSAQSFSRFGLGFVVGTDWAPGQERFGALPFLFGTVASSLLALMIAVPIALGIAIQLAEFTPAWLRTPLGSALELLAAIPSVVYGLWGVFVMVPWLRETLQPLLKQSMGSIPFFAGTPLGFGMMAAGLILALMILPTIASLCRDVFRAIPNANREAAIALGATRWETVRLAVLPSARKGILGAVILGLGRALGETMATTMVIGNRAEISASLFHPSATLASAIANEYAEAVGDAHLSALTGLGMLLLAITLATNVAARLLLVRPGGSR